MKNYVAGLTAAVVATLALAPAAHAATLLHDVDDYNAFILGDFVSGHSDVEGRLAAGGDATFGSYGVAQVGGGVDLGDTYTLVVGKTLTASDGKLVQGTGLATDAIVADSFVGQIDQANSGNPMLDFMAYANDLANRSASLATKLGTGTVAIDGTNLTLTGTSAGLNVFNLTGAQLSGKTTLTLSAPAGSSALVNVSGTSASLLDQGFTLEGIDKSKVLFNFPDTTDLKLSGIGVEGSFLAPKASVSFNNGQFNGVLVGGSFNGNGQLNYAPYKGGLLDGPAGGVPEPATWAMLITGFGLIGSAMRRRGLVPNTRALKPAFA